ncbi:MAG TPA: helix-turn-helix transcriptional regulator [Usitatibacter sp.]|jgi:DNA-binding CsgD family transcriptional regulator|nr:helix-turn-helix transcriptional regulator [Usitatibacter sp.]
MFQALKSSDLHAALASLRRLVASDFTTLSVCDLDSGHRSIVSDVPGAVSKAHVGVFDRHFYKHPLVLAHGRNRAAVTRRISDLVRPGDFRHSALYTDYYRAIRIEHAIAVPIHVHRHELVSFVLNRSGRDFSDRDRDLLESIRPLLGNLFRLGREIEGARAAWGVPSIAENPKVAPLTDRERDVLHWLAGGKTDRDIAAILGISPRTVHKHLQRIYEKLGVETRTAAVARALRGAVTPS